ncbi:hypothetical protein [Kribbella koreensis]
MTVADASTEKNGDRASDQHHSDTPHEIPETLDPHCPLFGDFPTLA